LAYEEEEEYRDEYRGHGIVCEGDLSRCSHVRARVRWETGYVGMSEIEYVSDVDLADVGESRSPVEDCKKASEKDGACLLTVKGRGKVVFLRGMPSGVISDSSEGVRHMAELAGMDMDDLHCRYDVKVGRKTIAVCHSKSAVKRHSSEYANATIENYIASHPVTMNVMAIDSIVLDEPGSIEESCGTADFHDFKGLYEPETETVYVNPCYRVAALVGARLGYGSVESVAEEYAEVVLHEIAHFMDDINAKEYRGGWEGELGLGALFGMPMPWGSELSSEEKAKEALEDIKRMDSTIMAKLASKLESEISDYEKYDPDAREALKQAKEFLEEVKKRGYDWFFGGTLDFEIVNDGEVKLSVHLEKDDRTFDPEESFRVMRQVYEDMKKEGKVDPDHFDVIMDAVGGILASDVPFIVIRGVMPDPSDYEIPLTLMEYY